MVLLSNPRKSATFDDWPIGRKRCTATFTVESNKRGERVARVTVGKPKRTTYYRRMFICDGDDGRTYLLGLSEYGQVVRIDGTLKGTEYCYPKECEQYDNYLAILKGES